MAIRSSGYYNNPAFAQAASNLASLFAPPSGADAAGWAAARERDAQAAKVQAEMRRADERRRYVDDPGFDQTRFDRLGVADGTYAPNQSYYAVDQTNATSRANNAADNAGSLARQYAEPILLNEGQTAVLPAQTQKATSLGQLYGGGVKLNQGEAYFGPSAGAAPAAGATPRLSDLFVKPGQAASAGPAPATPRSVASGQPGSVSGDDATAAVLSYMQSRGAQPTQGAAGPSAQPAQPLYRGDAKAPTSDEIKAQVLAALAPGEQRAAALGSTPVEAVVTPNGPRNVWQADSIGQVPYTAPSATSLEGDNYLAAGPNGQEKRFVGRPDAQGRIIDVNTGEVVPNVLRKEGTGGGMSFESGKDGSIRLVTGNGAGMTNSRVTDLQRQETESGRAVSELSTLFDTLRPDDLGAAGNVNEILTNYGAQMFPSLARPDVAGTRAQMEAVTLGIARTLVQDDRMSDADRRAANEVMVSGGLGESLPGAQAKIASLIALNAYRQKYANTVRTGGQQLPPLDAAMLGRLVDEKAISPRVAQVYARNVLSRGSQAPNGPLPGVNIPQGLPGSVPGAPALSAPALGAAPGGAQELPLVSSPQDAMRLPPGTRFRTPDGREKVRP